MAETRKLQITGISTYTISLPKAWVLKNKLSAGSELSLMEQQDGTISLFPRKASKQLKRRILHINDTSGDEEIGRAVLSAYLSGYTVIDIRSGSKLSASQRVAVSMQGKRLIGMEVIEEDDERIVLQDFFSPEYLSIGKAVWRAFNISRQMQKDLLEAMFAYDKEVASKVIALEEEVDKLFFLVRRQLDLAINNTMLMKVLNLDSSACLTFAFLIKEIEGISDCTAKLAERLIQLERPFPRNILLEIRKLSELAIELSADIMKALSKKDLELVNSVFTRQAGLQGMREDISKRAQKLPYPERFMLELMTADLISIIKHSSGMAEIVVDEISRTGA